MKTRIEVTQDDIEKGVAKNCSACPVARAITKKLRQGLVAGVSSVLLIDYYKFRLSIEAFLFVIDFDKGLPVQPFSFDLDLPAEFLKA